MIGFREAQVMVLVAVTSALGCEAFQNELQKLKVRGERTELKGMIDKVPMRNEFDLIDKAPLRKEFEPLNP